MTLDSNGLPTMAATATALARQSGALRSQAAEGPVLVTRRGRPVAVLVTTPEVVAASGDGQQVSARELNRAGAASACLDAVEGGECRVLTDHNRPVAVLEPVEAFLRRVRSVVDAAFADVAVPAAGELALGTGPETDLR